MLKVNSIGLRSTTDDDRIGENESVTELGWDLAFIVSLAVFGALVVMRTIGGAI